jgi:hypothetical protein
MGSVRSLAGAPPHSALRELQHDDHLIYLHRDGRRPMFGDLDMDGHSIVNAVLEDLALEGGLSLNGDLDMQGHSILNAVLEDITLGGGLTLGGDLDMQGNDILDVGTVDGIDVGAHASRHQSGGADPLSHSLLPGLGSDDHPQYLPLSGVRAMTGDLDMNANDIIDVATVDGVDVSAHASRHQNGGADQLSHSVLAGLSSDDHLQYLPRSGARAMTGDLDMGSQDIANLAQILSAFTAAGTITSGASPALMVGNDALVFSWTGATTSGLKFNTTDLQIEFCSGVNKNIIIYMSGAKRGAMKLVPVSSTTAAEAGVLYFDSDTNRLMCHNGTAWKTITWA